jgi:hypothetical protein
MQADAGKAVALTSGVARGTDGRGIGLAASLDSRRENIPSLCAFFHPNYGDSAFNPSWSAS